jgi:hypothetical protein
MNVAVMKLIPEMITEKRSLTVHWLRYDGHTRDINMRKT